MRAPVPAVAFVAPSDTGKTTFLVEVIRELRRRGRTVGAVKHAPHGFEDLSPETDSRRLAEAGASPAAVVSGRRALLEVSGPEGDLDPGELIGQHFRQVEMVLLEGYKGSPYPKIEVHRTGLGKDLLLVGKDGRSRDPRLLAVVSDGRPKSDLPLFPLHDPRPLCDFLERLFLPPRS